MLENPDYIIQSPKESIVDPLSDVLSLMKPRSYLSAGVDAGGDWCIQFPDQQQCLKTGAVVVGQCWLWVEGVPDAVKLETGDCFLLPHGRPFRLGSDLALSPVAATDVFSGSRNGGITSHQGGGDCFVVSSRFAVEGDESGLLQGILPPLVHIRQSADRGALRWSIEAMMRELREEQPGSLLVIGHLAHMILVQALRAHLSESPKSGVGWFSALADKQVGAAIRAIHAKPAHRWTLRELADCADVSRSTFALKFKETVGTTPIQYLTRWRMLLASDRLSNSKDSIATVAFSLGYESESAFSTAFKRVMGSSPRLRVRNIKSAPART